MATKNPPEKNSEPEKKEQISVPETPSDSAKPISGDELALPIVENMPEPTPGAIKEEESGESSAENPPQVSGSTPPVVPPMPENIPQVKDSTGAQFDPKIHRADEAGNPRISPSTGKFLKKYKADPNASAATQSTPASSAPSFASVGTDQFDNAAEMLLQTSYGVAASFLTNDIRPDSVEEHASLKLPLAAVLREKGSLGMSPTQALMLSVAAYVAKKAAKPTVRDRLVLLYIKARAFIKGEKAPQIHPPEIPPVIEPTK